MLERLFKLTEHRTTARTEILGGATTFVTMAYNIANGLTAGLTLYPVIKLATGRGRELSPGSIVLALLCGAYYVFGLPP